MATVDQGIFSLNAGEISRLALARVDLAKLRIATERQANMLPHVVGPCMLRPGTQYIATTPSHAAGWLGEFYYSETVKALLVATAAGLQFIVNDSYVTRVAVTATVANGNFDTNLASWTDSSEAGASAAWVTGGYAGLTGTGTNYAYLDQQVTVTETGTEHALRVVVARNTVVLKIGTSQGGSSYFDVVLLPGTYSLAFTPSGNFWIRVGANSAYTALVDSINVEGAGAVSLPVPWSTTAHFDSIRYDQSGDVLFVASTGFQQRRIERRASDSRSWGIALYQSDDGPFRLGNTSDVQIQPSSTVGSVTLTATRDIFKSGHAGALYKLTHSAQAQSTVIAGANQFTGAIRVSGLTSNFPSSTPSSRAFAVTITGTYTGVVRLQRSIGEPGAWSDVKSWTNATTSESYDDGLNNQIIYYRLGIKTGEYTSGTANVALNYNGSVQTGIARITQVTGTTTATADVLSQFGDVAATSDWAEGEWSDYRGWPSAVALHDGRLAWFPSIKAHLSVSDAFASFDDTVEGDSGPINKTIATGGLDGIRAALSLQRLLALTAAQEISVRASAFDEPLTPTAFVARVCSSRGSSKTRPVKVDANGIFVGRDTKRVYELAYDLQAGDYRTKELTRLKQEMCSAGVRDIAVQRQPDTRIWFVLGDGTCACLTYDVDDEVVAWVPVTTDGTFERVAVLPGSDEDDVYFIVNRNIGGTKRYIEKLSKRTESQGGTLSKTMDAHMVYSGIATGTITGLSHLEGKQVVVWGDGAPVVTMAAPKTVSGGQITGISPTVANAVVGLPYTGQIKTVKLAYAAEHGTALTMRKRVARVGLVLADVAWKGVQIGRDFITMRGLPATYRGKTLTAGQVLTAYDAEPTAFSGGWDPDARVCIQVTSPYCCTIEAIVLHMDTNESADEAKSAPGNG